MPHSQGLTNNPYPESNNTIPCIDPYIFKIYRMYRGSNKRKYSRLVWRLVWVPQLVRPPARKSEIRIRMLV